MFGTIRKHQSWLWVVIITLTVISFVVYFSPYSRLNSGGARRAEGRGSINGEKITDGQYINAYREWDLHNFLNGGHWLSEARRSEQDTTRDIYQWLLIIQKQQQYGIHVSEQDCADMAKLMLLQRLGRDASPQLFIQRVLQPHGYSVEDFERYVRHSIGLQELMNTVGLSGRLVTPEEAKIVYQHEHQEVASSAVLFSASNYMASVIATPDQISQFYSNRQNLYAIPERVALNYVKFNVTNFLAQAQTEVTNLSEIVEANYQRMGTNAFPEAKTPDEAKAKIREQLLRREAMVLAHGKANELYQKLAAMSPVRADNLMIVASSNGLPVATSAPFDSQDGPKDMDAGPDFAKKAFGLTQDEPFALPHVGEDGVYVVALNQTLPREIPPLDQIRPKVVADYKHYEGMIQARDASLGFYQTLTNGLEQGKSLADLCAQAKLKATELPPFSISTQHLPVLDELMPDLGQLKQAAFMTPAGKASSPLRTSDGFMLLYVKAKLPLDQAKMQADMPGFVNSLRRTRQQEAFNEWFRVEAERGFRDTPLNRPPPTLGTAAKS